MSLEKFEPIFMESRAEWAKNSSSSSDTNSPPLRRFLVHIFAPDYYHLQIQATDFHSNTFRVVYSVSQLDDLRDRIGIGGSWSEFIDYFVASVKSDSLKLVLQISDSDGVLPLAKLVAQKSKGLPLISVKISKFFDSDACDVMEKLSFGLFDALKCGKRNLGGGDGEMLSVEMERSGLVKKQKVERINSSDVVSRNSPDKQGSVQGATPKKKVANRVVSAYRRAKVRGAVLQDTEED